MNGFLNPPSVETGNENLYISALKNKNKRFMVNNNIMNKPINMENFNQPNNNFAFQRNNMMIPQNYFVNSQAGQNNFRFNQMGDPQNNNIYPYNNFRFNSNGDNKSSTEGNKEINLNNGQNNSQPKNNLKINTGIFFILFFFKTKNLIYHN